MANNAANDALYLLFWKPQVGMPVALAQFDRAVEAVTHMRELVTARTSTGGWRVLPMPGPRETEQREFLLTNTLGQVESYYISEHHHAAVPGTPMGAAPAR